MHRVARCLALLTLATPLNAQTPITPNDNRIPAGTLKDGTLTINLEIKRAMWYPDGYDMPGISVLAFAETGKAPSVPGPLLRAPVGTRVHARITNTLTDSTISVFGLNGNRKRDDATRIKPGETIESTTLLDSVGSFFYRGEVGFGPDNRNGVHGNLGGALVVDDPNDKTSDRVLVILQYINHDDVKPFPGAVEELLSINGLIWPKTERLEYDSNETIRWRVINASYDMHPMHLHGAFFNVLQKGGLNTNVVYRPEEQRQVVTERMNPLSSMMMEWKPAHAGNWLFHCHLVFHIMDHPPLGEMKASSHEDPYHMVGMGGLVLGTTIRGPIAKDEKPRRNIRLRVEQYDSVPNEYSPPFSYELDDARKMSIPGPPIILTKGEPVTITVVNRLKAPTAVHWHGLEIHSYYDGVHGFGGDPLRTTPMIAVNDSFVAYMNPPRAGTFIYHNHADEARQQGGGLYGPLVVLNKGEKWDPDYNRFIIFATGRDSANEMQINGEEKPRMDMQAGKTYKLRMINITLERPGVTLSIIKDGKPVEWDLLARDGADLPPSQRGVQAAVLPLTIGQTNDALFTPSAGEYKVVIAGGRGTVLRTLTIMAR
jgi:FtsP/CotA-like multicopper oxidase with cupredoxin domain